MHGLRVTPRAQDDLRNIGRYMERQWGKRQRNTYLKALEKRFGCLAESPQLGKRRTDVAEGYYSFPEGEHVAFYLRLEVRALISWASRTRRSIS